MPYITSVEEIGFERGLQQGMERGLEQGQRSLILKQLQRRVGELPDTLRSQFVPKGCLQHRLSLTELES